MANRARRHTSIRYQPWNSHVSRANAPPSQFYTLAPIFILDEMSSLRRRIFGVSSSDSPSSSGTSTPTSGDRAEDVTVVPSKHLEKLAQKAKQPKGTKRRNAWIFGLGGVFGLMVAAFFAGNQEMLDLKALADLNLDSLLDVLPAGLIQDAKDLQVCGALGPLFRGCQDGLGWS